MKKMTRKYHYVYVDPAGTPECRYLLCPNCGEMLQPADVEAFSSCPYCNTHLTLSNDLENFILSPVISSWLKELRRHANGNDGIHFY